jgi:hypothetical protein
LGPPAAQQFESDFLNALDAVVEDTQDRQKQKGNTRQGATVQHRTVLGYSTVLGKCVLRAPQHIACIWPAWRLGSKICLLAQLQHST